MFLCLMSTAITERKLTRSVAGRTDAQLTSEKTNSRNKYNKNVTSCNVFSKECQVNVFVALPVLFSSARYSSTAGDGAGVGIPFCLRRPPLQIPFPPFLLYQISIPGLRLDFNSGEFFFSPFPGIPAGRVCHDAEISLHLGMPKS